MYQLGHGESVGVRRHPAISVALCQLQEESLADAGLAGAGERSGAKPLSSEVDVEREGGEARRLGVLEVLQKGSSSQRLQEEIASVGTK